METGNAVLVVIIPGDFCGLVIILIALGLRRHIVHERNRRPASDFE